MLRWALIFFVVALVAAVFGFGNIAAKGAQGIATIIFFLFIVLFLVSLMAGLVGGRSRKIDV